MFSFGKTHGKNKQLNELIKRIEMNMSNNYKDAAQADLKAFEEAFGTLKTEGVLSEMQKAYYEVRLADFKERMKQFTHKDQKPTWV